MLDLASFSQDAAPLFQSLGCKKAAISLALAALPALWLAPAAHAQQGSMNTPDFPEINLGLKPSHISYSATA
jgi:hypothetical protein